MPSGEIKLPFVEIAQKRVVSAGSAQSNQQQPPSLEIKAAPLSLSHQNFNSTRPHCLRALYFCNSVLLPTLFLAVILTH